MCNYNEIGEKNMTKRKRELITIVDSINHWFEAGGSNTQTSESPKRETVSCSTVSTLLVQPTNQSGVEEVVVPRTEVEQVVPGLSYEGTTGGLRSDVATKTPINLGHPAQLAAVTGRGPDHEGRTEGRDSGYPAGTSDLPGPSTGAETERQLVLEAFWQLLADAGYETW